MRRLKRFVRRLTAWRTKKASEERIQSEIEEHIAFQTDDNVRAGLSPEEARRQALLKFGTVEAMKEGYRDQRGLPSIESLFQDTRHALRRLRKAPAFTITTVLTLALGIGATTSIFTLVHAVLVKQLAVTNPAELYRLGRESRCCYWNSYSQEKEFSLVSYDLYKHFRDHTKGFAELAAFQASKILLGVRRAGSMETAHTDQGEFVSGNYFTMFGLHAYAGRLLTPEDDRPGAASVAVMSHRLWQERYGSDPGVVGSVFNVNDKPVTIAGIAPPDFYGDSLATNPPDFFMPLNQEPLIESDNDLNDSANAWLDMIGRIRPGVAATSVEAAMRVELKQWLYSQWDRMSANDRTRIPRQTLYLTPGGAGITAMRERYERWLLILMIASGLVLLIVCANVASLMLVRGMERRRQISVSMALGARPSRLVRQPLIESVVLSLFGGAAGVGVALALTRLIIHFTFPAAAGKSGIPINASPSAPVLLFAFGVSLLAAVVFGIAPAWMATRVDSIEALRGAGRSTARSGSLMRRVLVVCQAALSFVLLTAAGLLSAALGHLENQNFGFEQDRRIVAAINPRLASYKPAQLTPLYQRIHDELAALPGVAAVALCVYSPMNSNNWGAGIIVDGRPAPGPNEDNGALWDRITPGFLAVVGNPMLRGRPILEQDTANSRHVAVINEAFARKFFPNQDPIGKHFGQHGIGSEREYEIVGIARDARYLTFRLDKPISPFFFLPESQHDFAPKETVEANPGSHYLHDIVIVTNPGVNLSFDTIRRALAGIDPNLPVLGIRPLSEQVYRLFTQQRLIARLTSFFGILSLVLSCLGLYGVTAYNAGQRSGEIGVRMALGANRGHVIGMVLRGAFALVLVGLVLGAPLILAAGRILGSQLYGLNPFDPGVIASAVVALGSSALVAALLPALRASSISPFEALRAE